MRILWLSNEIPEFPSSAVKAWNYLALRELSKRHQITYVPLRADPGQTKELLADLGVASLPAGLNRQQAQAIWQGGKRKIGTLEVIAKRFRRIVKWLFGASGNYLDVEAEIELWRSIFTGLQEGDYDLVHCDHARYAPLFHAFSKFLPRSLFVHDLYWFNLTRRPLQSSSWLGRWLIRAEVPRVERDEINAVCLADGSFVVSDREKRWIDQRADTRLCVLPVGIDCQYFQAEGEVFKPPSGGPWFVYPALIGHAPHADAVLFFAEEILPLIRLSFPDAGFLIVGREPPARVLELAVRDCRIIVTGQVPDIRPYMRAADICVVPMRFGAGVRVKIMEAMASGKPLVSTSVGCEGLNLTPGQHLLQADSAEEFAAAVKQLLEDEPLRSNLSKQGMAYARDNFTYQGQVAKMEAHWLALIQNKAGRQEPDQARRL